MTSKIIKFVILAIASIGLIIGNLLMINKIVHADVNGYTADAYDLSQWQNSLTDSQTQKLKREVKFIILRVQYGSAYQDHVFNNNEAMLRKYNIPYGVYSYSRYKNEQDAQNEAQSLYRLAPKAQFYVNDAEEIDTNNKQNFVNATIAWAQKMKNQTNKKVVLYSSQSMLDKELQNARNAYTNIWLANYTKYEPSPAYRYDLWQFTDKYASQALNQNVDASIIPSGGHSLLTMKSNPVYKTKYISKSYKKNRTTINDNNQSKKGTQPINQYYNNSKIVFMEVINKNGLYLYNYNTNKRVKHIDYGHYLLVNKFFERDHTTNALSNNNQYYTSNKRYVKPITDKKILKQLSKTLK